VSADRIGEQWRDLNYLSEPNYDAACREYDAFTGVLEELGVSIEWMPGEDVGLDSMYVRDASIVTEVGAVLCNMGKGTRAKEPVHQEARLEEVGVHVAGAISDAGTLEGGDTTWLGPDTLVVGRGYRTNEDGIAQLRALLPEVEVITVDLPHWKGPADVFHLMSILSPLDADLLLVYSPLMPVVFRQSLVQRGFRLIEVPDEEFESQGCNVLAAGPSLAVGLEGNPETRHRMEAAGVEVHSYHGAEISLKGCGGPTCLTRPLERGQPAADPS
jgi:N-dimethylarginine dimethylaminohydrolase